MMFKLASMGFRNPTLSFNAVASPSKLPDLQGFNSSSGAEARCNLPMLDFSRAISIRLRHKNFRSRSVISFAAFHEESEDSDVELKEGQVDVNAEAQRSEEAWQQALVNFKEQTLKMQSVSKEAYDVYSKKAIIILKEASENFKTQAERARQDLSVAAKDIAEESKQYFDSAAENSPEPLQEILEAFTSSPADFSDVSEVRDFYVGIPYGAYLSVGGFLSFMLTGSISAIRFGVILGGTILALSILSFRAWKDGEQSFSALVGQTVISTILFARELQLRSARPFAVKAIATFISGAVVAFYVYRIILDRQRPRTS